MSSYRDYPWYVDVLTLVVDDSSECGRRRGKLVTDRVFEHDFLALDAARAIVRDLDDEQIVVVGFDNGTYCFEIASCARVGGIDFPGVI